MAQIIQFPRKSDDEPVVVEEGSGWWKDEGGCRVSAPSIEIDSVKLAKAHADCDYVASIMGWK